MLARRRTKVRRAEKFVRSIKRYFFFIFKIHSKNSGFYRILICTSTAKSRRAPYIYCFMRSALFYIFFFGAGAENRFFTIPLLFSAPARRPLPHSRPPMKIFLFIVYLAQAEETLEECDKLLEEACLGGESLGIL